MDGRRVAARRPRRAPRRRRRRPEGVLRRPRLARPADVLATVLLRHPGPVLGRGPGTGSRRLPVRVGARRPAARHRGRHVRPRRSRPERCPGPRAAGVLLPLDAPRDAAPHGDDVVHRGRSPPARRRRRPGGAQPARRHHDPRRTGHRRRRARLGGHVGVGPPPPGARRRPPRGRRHGPDLPDPCRRGPRAARRPGGAAPGSRPAARLGRRRCRPPRRHRAGDRPRHPHRGIPGLVERRRGLRVGVVHPPARGAPAPGLGRDERGRRRRPRRAVRRLRPRLRRRPPADVVAGRPRRRRHRARHRQDLPRPGVPRPPAARRAVRRALARPPHLGRDRGAPLRRRVALHRRVHQARPGPAARVVRLLPPPADRGCRLPRVVRLAAGDGPADAPPRPRVARRPRARRGRRRARRPADRRPRPRHRRHQVITWGLRPRYMGAPPPGAPGGGLRPPRPLTWAAGPCGSLTPPLLAIWHPIGACAPLRSVPVWRSGTRSGLVHHARPGHRTRGPSRLAVWHPIGACAPLPAPRTPSSGRHGPIGRFPEPRVSLSGCLPPVDNSPRRVGTVHTLLSRKDRDRSRPKEAG
ncbi:hypothetical protein BN12_920006 [Nostocoides japonicum T1-X7]|uniref:Uncharacterized protein n=1 Tax=Nostocoides japonicum T1-X7 TaxID=1194083 RepID=A0A077M241_9MICO|nr:hypothetical protein BN12_920006 [Tetrasphaera japonica T1-X7]